MTQEAEDKQKSKYNQVSLLKESVYFIGRERNFNPTRVSQWMCSSNRSGSVKAAEYTETYWFITIINDKILTGYKTNAGLRMMDASHLEKVLLLFNFLQQGKQMEAAPINRFLPFDETFIYMPHSMPFSEYPTIILLS